MVTFLITTSVTGLSRGPRSTPVISVTSETGSHCPKMVWRLLRCGRALGDEELRAVGVRARVGHRQQARLVELEVRPELVLEAVAGIARAGAQRIAALDHELRDDAVELDPVVERLLRPTCRVLGSVQARMPLARPTKLVTVFGASFSKSSQVNAPIVVSILRSADPEPARPFVASRA